MVAELLHEMGYGLQANRKTLEGNELFILLQILIKPRT
jgi:hypothetical protein